MRVLKNDLPVLARKLSEVYGFRVRLIGPYLCRDGRKRVDVRPLKSNSTTNKLCKTVQLARVRLEIKIGRPLVRGEDVDHRNNDHTDDSYGNVQLLSHSQNAAKVSARGRKNQRLAMRRPEVRQANSKRNQGECNNQAKVNNSIANKLRRHFLKFGDFQYLLSVVPFNGKSLLACLSGKTYRDAGGPTFEFAHRTAGRGRKPLNYRVVL